MGTKAEFDLILKHAGNFDKDQFEYLKSVVIFENGLELPVSDVYLQKLADDLSLDDVFVFRGPIESCYLLS